MATLERPKYDSDEESEEEEQVEQAPAIVEEATIEHVAPPQLLIPEQQQQIEQQVVQNVVKAPIQYHKLITNATAVADDDIDEEGFQVVKVINGTIIVGKEDEILNLQKSSTTTATTSVATTTTSMPMDGTMMYPNLTLTQEAEIPVMTMEQSNVILAPELIMMQPQLQQSQQQLLPSIELLAMTQIVANVGYLNGYLLNEQELLHSFGKVITPITNTFVENRGNQ